MERILVVEDSLDVQELVGQAFRGSLNIIFSNSLQQARLKLREFTFELVVLDITLPDGDGYELCNEIPCQ